MKDGSQLSTVSALGWAVERVGCVGWMSFRYVYGPPTSRKQRAGGVDGRSIRVDDYVYDLIMDLLALDLTVSEFDAFRRPA